MKKLALLFILFSSITFAQDKRTLNLGEFNSIKVFTGLKVQLIQSSEQKIEISGKNQRYIIVKNKNGHLSIRLKLTESLRKYDFDIKLYTNRNIDVIDVNEGAHVFSDDTVNQLNITLKAQEGSFISIPLDVKYLTVKIISGSNIKTKGKAKSQDVRVGQGGVYDAYNLETEQTKVIVATGGKAEISVSDILDASVRLGGNVYYKGNPDIKKSRKFIGGVIKYKD
jgi:Putative auto-transporter adhesin, head GIN domain